MLPDTFVILSLALIIDAAVGYPGSVYERIGHPVSWIGTLITALDRRYNIEGRNADDLKRRGGLVLLGVIGVSVAVASALSSLVFWPFSYVWQALLASAFLASSSLYDHVEAVSTAFDEEGLEAGRKAVAKIVGRDTTTLDRHGVARAAIESLAENASDGVVAPAFWLLVGGLPGLVAYKAINTADSMIGHKTPRYASFGWASARLDDVVNLPASRLTALFYVVAALITPGASAQGAVRAIFSDARLHRSPNAGWPESAVAGALGLKLAGPRVYDGVEVQDAYMGNGRAEATAADIDRALALSVRAWGIMFAFMIGVGIVLTI